MFGKQRKTTNANTSNEMAKPEKNGNMTSGSRSTKSVSNASNSTTKADSNKASSAKACGGKCKTKSVSNKTTKSCS